MSYGNPLHGLDGNGDPADQTTEPAVEFGPRDDRPVHHEALAALNFTPDDTGIGLPLDDRPAYPPEERLAMVGLDADGAPAGPVTVHRDGDVRRTGSGQLQEWGDGAWHDVADPPGLDADPPTMNPEPAWFAPRTAERLIALTERYVRDVTALTDVPARAPRTATDGGTRAFQAATGHECLACPLPVRELYAAAHNADQAWHAAWDANRQGLAGDYSRAHRKQEELAAVLAKLAPLLDAHFNALNQWSDR